VLGLNRSQTVIFNFHRPISGNAFSLETASHRPLQTDSFSACLILLGLRKTLWRRPRVFRCLSRVSSSTHGWNGIQAGLWCSALKLLLWKRTKISPSTVIVEMSFRLAYGVQLWRITRVRIPNTNQHLSYVAFILAGSWCLALKMLL
jgi:hypothetical protein